MLPGNVLNIYSYILPVLLNVTVNISTSNEGISLCFCPVISVPPSFFPVLPSLVAPPPHLLLLESRTSWKTFQILFYSCGTLAAARSMSGVFSLNRSKSLNVSAQWFWSRKKKKQLQQSRSTVELGTCLHHPQGQRPASSNTLILSVFLSSWDLDHYLSKLEVSHLWSQSDS